LETLPIIDCEGNVVGWADKLEAHLKGLRHRVACVLLFKNGRIILQQRSALKETWPLWWDFTASGHVVKGERVEKAAERELMEEAGVRAALTPFKRVREKSRHNPYKENQDCFVFTGITEKELKPNCEVARFKSLTPKQVETFLQGEKVTPALRKALEALLKSISGGDERSPFAVSRRARARGPRRVGRKPRRRRPAPAKRRAKQAGLLRRSHARGRALKKRVSKHSTTRR